MIKLRRLFLKNFTLGLLITSLVNFNFINIYQTKKKSKIRKKKSKKYTWYLDVNDK